MDYAVEKQLLKRAGSTLGTWKTIASVVDPKERVMKNKVFSAVVTCCLLTLGLGATAYAQLPGTALRANIPFAFTLRGKTLPAGDYQIERLLTEPGVLVISNVARHEHEEAVFQTVAVSVRKAPKRGEIIFHRYGDTYFLSEVLSGGERTGGALPQTRQERDLKRDLISRGEKSEPETVALAVY